MLLINLFILAVLGFRCHVGFSQVAVSGDYALVTVCRPVIAMASLVAEHGL